MARKASEPALIAGSGFLVGSSNFWVPPYRSWPHPPSELEQLAARMRISDDELRLLLAEEIQRRGVAQAGDSPEARPVHHQHGI